MLSLLAEDKEFEFDSEVGEEGSLCKHLPIDWKQDAVVGSFLSGLTGSEASIREAREQQLTVPQKGEDFGEAGGGNDWQDLATALVWG